eukprot:GHVP01032210.1.p1 GENE.GHVP01032210.1~~GHVP01032210.1.p1  ORF type:complete len:105 (+),score=10.57 GHVP01032210.1:166-480(+)
MQEKLFNCNYNCLAGEASSMSITNLEYKRRIEGLLGSYHIATTFRYIPSKDNPADIYSRQFEVQNKIRDPWVLKRLVDEISRKATKIKERRFPARNLANRSCKK